MGAVTAVALLLEHGAGVLSLLSLGPAFAAVIGGVRYTLITGIVSTGLSEALAVSQELASQQDTLAVATVAGVTVAALITSAARRRRERELSEVRAIAEVTQQVLLRPVPTQVGAVRLAVRYIAAASGARIGGDLYEVVTTGAGGMRLIVGDVQGKGLPAVQTAATVLGAFREVVHDAAGLAVIADRIEASLARQIGSEEFVTALIAQVNPDGSKIEILNCGHPSPLLCTGGECRFVEPAEACLPLGLASLALNSPAPASPRRVPAGGPPAEPAVPAPAVATGRAGQPVTIELAPGGRILFYTDGISEARGRSGEFFPLASWFGRAADRDPDPALSMLGEEVRRFVGHALDDDAAMLLIHRDPPGPAVA
jgi:serine phosphatase RsbU (regulator of sigma subunit)